MNSEFIHDRLDQILQQAKCIDFSQEVEEAQREIFSETVLYIVDDRQMTAILALEKKAISLYNEQQKLPKRGRKALKKRDYIGKEFFEYGKILNREHPAYKYSFYVAKHPVEVFDRDKVKERIPTEFSKWKNKEMHALKKVLKERKLTSEQENALLGSLNTKIADEERQINTILENWNDYDVVITNREHCKTYPSIYYTLDLTDSKASKNYKKESCYLRSNTKNILWYNDARAFRELKADDKIGKIIQTHTPYCKTIYAKKR